jgi:hypothetical protein
VSVTAIAALKPRQRATVWGNVARVTAKLHPWTRTDVVLCDVTGTITLRFLGWRSIAGMTEGRGILGQGTPSEGRHGRVILNPLYAFVEPSGLGS